MRVFTVASMASVAVMACWGHVTEAAPHAALSGPRTSLEQSFVRSVDSAGQAASQRGGIVNERSTGNEPFMGPGASGGPTHSAPGATHNTQSQEPTDRQQGMSRPDHGAASQNNERQAFQRLESDPTVQGQDLVNQQREQRQ
jgi:hypothetical protein